MPVNSVRELVALAKAKSGELNYGATSAGAANYLAAELFRARAGVDIVRIPYRGGSLAFSATIAGEVHTTFASPGAAALHVKSGRLKALAVTTAQPTVLAPGLPTVAASGYPGFEASSMLGLFLRAKTPAALVTSLNQEIVGVFRKPEVKDQLFEFGTEGVGSKLEEFTAVIKSEMALMGKPIRDVGIRAE